MKTWEQFAAEQGHDLTTTRSARSITVSMASTSSPTGTKASSTFAVATGRKRQRLSILALIQRTRRRNYDDPAH